jgi:adenylate cyclase
MEQLAEPGRVYVTESTARLVSGQFVLRDLGRSSIKGASDPVGVYEIEAAGPARTRLEVARTRGLTRFVGRSAEATLLDTALTRATGGEAQIVGVVGEAGVGKSRLCVEFIERCRARAVPVYEAHCLSHGAALPFHPIVQLLRAVCGVREHDAPEAARRTIAGTAVLLDDRLREALPLVFDFLGVPDPERPLARMEPEARQRQLLDFATALVRARSARQPAVLLIDDLHWIDAASDALLAGFLAAVVGSRTLLLLNFRPEYTREWMSRADYQQIALRPLRPEATAELPTVLLGADASLAPVTALVAARAGGNPFFAEEIVHALVEQGVLAGARGAYRLVRPVGDVNIPPTVQAILAARVDRLGERDKSVIQTAAIIGKEFSEPLLQRVAACPAAELSAALAALVRGEFIVERALYPEREYAFRHPLTQEVVYRSQLTDRRTAVHAAVAGALEVIHSTRLGEHAALLAHHWEAAGDAVAAARWHTRAARWIGARDRAQMMRHWRQARALLDGTPESPETLVRRVTSRIQMIHAGVYVGLDDAEASALFTEAMQLAEHLGQVGLQVWLLAEHSAGRASAGYLDEGLRHLQVGLDLADRSGNALDRFGSRIPGPPVLIWAGRLREAVAMSQEVETLSGGDPEMAAGLVGFSPLGLTLNHRARALAQMARLRDAWEAVAAATTIGQAREDREVLVMADVVRAEISYFAVQARAAASRVFESRFRSGVLGQVYVLNGQWAEAIQTLIETLDRMRKRRLYLLDEAWALALLAEAYAGTGAVDRARESAEQAVDCARQRQVPVGEIHALLARARVLRMTDGAASAPRIADDLGAAEALITGTEAHAYTPFVHEQRAELARLLGDAATCERELRGAHRLFTEMGATGHAERLAKELAGKDQ